MSENSMFLPSKLFTPTFPTLGMKWQCPKPISEHLNNTNFIFARNEDWKPQLKLLAAVVGSASFLANEAILILVPKIHPYRKVLLLTSSLYRLQIRKALKYMLWEIAESGPLTIWLWLSFWIVSSLQQSCNFIHV